MMMGKFGIIINDTSGLASTQAQIGGSGVTYWKMLMNGSHLVGPWNCVEYVVLPPGTSIGLHHHGRTEEIYFIIRGSPTMTIDGDDYDCIANDVITAPIGTTHGIRNDTREDVCFFVTEVFPGAGSSEPALRTNLTKQNGGGRFDLSGALSGGWRFIELVTIEPNGELKFEESDNAEVVFVLDGSAEVTVGGETVQALAGFAIASPPHRLRQFCAKAENALHAIRLAVAT